MIEDCTHALQLDSQYVKALLRRGQAYEAVGQLREAIHDYTTICILKKFQDQESMLIAERALQAFGKQRAQVCFRFRRSRFRST